MKPSFGVLLQFWSDCSRTISGKEFPFSIELLLYFCQKSVDLGLPGGSMAKMLPSSGEGVGVISSRELRSSCIVVKKSPKT